MESLLAKMTDLYQKEKQNESNKENSPNLKDNKNLIEKVYILDKNILKNEGELNKRNNEFNLPLFQNEKELMKYIENQDIPMKYVNKIIKEIFKYKNKDIIITFIQKNKDKLTEKNLVLIFKKIKELDKKNSNDIIKCVLNNILVDENYLLELLKEEKDDLNKEIIESINTSLKHLDNPQNKMGLIQLTKTLNLISMIKEIIGKEDYDKYEKNINDLLEEELNKRENQNELNDDEFNKDFNMEFINSMKIINSNPNKAYFIQENIII